MWIACHLQGSKGGFPLCKTAPDFVITPMKTQASYSSWPFLILEAPMNPIPLAAAILVKVILAWWMAD